MKKYKGNITISGKTYPCEVKKGIRYVNGLTIENFIKTLNTSQINEMATVGKQAIDNEKIGSSKFSLQNMANDLHSSKFN